MAAGVLTMVIAIGERCPSQRKELPKLAAGGRLHIPETYLSVARVTIVL
jgi:hypothetical protein